MHPVNLHIKRQPAWHSTIGGGKRITLPAWQVTPLNSQAQPMQRIPQAPRTVVGVRRSVRHIQQHPASALKVLLLLQQNQRGGWMNAEWNKSSATVC